MIQGTAQPRLVMVRAMVTTKPCYRVHASTPKDQWQALWDGACKRTMRSNWSDKQWSDKEWSGSGLTNPTTRYPPGRGSSKLTPSSEGRGFDFAASPRISNTIARNHLAWYMRRPCELRDVAWRGFPGVLPPERLAVLWRIVQTRSDVAGKLLTCEFTKKQRFEHHARPRRASAASISALRTGADMSKTGAGTGSCAGAKTEPGCGRSSHEWTEDQTGRRRLANGDVDGGRRVHSTD